MGCEVRLDSYLLCSSAGNIAADEDVSNVKRSHKNIYTKWT